MKKSKQKRKMIVAIDSFKGCLTSMEANQAASDGVRLKMSEAEVVQIPVSDGGEGWLEAFQTALGGELVQILVKDPLMRPVVAPYLVQGDKAVIEMAKASGLTLLAPEERNPLVASSYGTGQLVADAIRRGCKDIIVGLGGSATSDCGLGMLRAVIDAFTQQLSLQEESINPGTWNEVLAALHDVKFTIATDVTNPLCGKQGAAEVFAPQKGATPEMIRCLDARARRFAEDSARHFGYDCQNQPGAGAAGGLGYAFMQYMKAECRSGIELLLDAVHFDELLKDADLVITGEGSADRQTLMGKLPYGILQRARHHNIPVCLLAGRIKDQQLLIDAGFTHVKCINPPELPLEEAMKPETAKRNICQCVCSCLQ
jgi:glycerate kinase